MSLIRLSQGAVTVSGAIAQKPAVSGHAWMLLQYLLGLRKLGFDVLFVDQLTNASPKEIAWLESVMSQTGLDQSWSLLFEGGSIGLPRGRVIERVRSSLFLLNVMGFLKDEEILTAAHRRVFLDIDPGFGQMWHELGLADVFAGHDHFVTIGENIGKPRCRIPTCGLNWLTTRQPVVLDEWPLQGPSGTSFTSVGRWRSDYAPVVYEGQTFGLRVHEFRKFMTLPRLVNETFELALDIDSGETPDLALLKLNGWRLVPPEEVAGDLGVYRSYLQASMAEFLVAKNMYVDTRSGWFSDRSACYLASGRPVVAQDTGLAELYPIGEGLVAYQTLDEAVAAVNDIGRDYRRHARRAREIADEFFNSDKVLTRLVEAVAD